VSTVLFALVWVPRKLLGKLSGVKHLSARIWPLIATLSLAVFIAPWRSRWTTRSSTGTRNWRSMTIFACTLAFPTAALVGLIAAYRVPKADERRRPLPCARRLAGLGIAAAYLAYWGMAGWRSWS